MDKASIGMSIFMESAVCWPNLADGDGGPEPAGYEIQKIEAKFRSRNKVRQ